MATGDPTCPLHGNIRFAACGLCQFTEAKYRKLVLDAGEPFYRVKWRRGWTRGDDVAFRAWCLARGGDAEDLK